MSAQFWANFTLQSYNCFYAIMVWDYLLAIQKERKKIWQREWTVVKGIYLFNRYYGLAAMTMNLCFYNINVSRAACNRYVRAEPGSSIPIILAYQSVLLLRCFAVWSRNKIILFIGLTLMTGQMIVQSYASSRMFPTPIPVDVGPCVVNGAKGLIASYFLLPACTDTVLTFLTFFRLLYLTRTTKSPLVITFMREGFVFFMIVFVANALNGILYLQNDTDISTIGSGFAIIMGNVCGSHLILRNRKDAEPSGAVSNFSSTAGSRQNHPGYSGGRFGSRSGTRIDTVELSTVTTEQLHTKDQDAKGSVLPDGVYISKNTETVVI